MEGKLKSSFLQKIFSIQLTFQSWLEETCKTYGWSHSKSPLIWREIGITGVNVTYIGGSYQFWKFLYKYYRIKSHLTEEDLNALQADFIFVGTY